MTVTDNRPNEFTDLADPRWLALFENVRESWFRLETLQAYAVDYEQDEFDRFARTGQFDRAENDWQRMIRRHTTAARRLQRVHVIVEPVTPYLRYEFAAYRQNGAAGEDIRLIPVRGDTWPAGLPQGDDFWLFDDREVWNMHYDSAGHFLSASLAASVERVEQCRRWRDIALAEAVPMADYMTSAAA